MQRCCSGVFLCPDEFHKVALLGVLLLLAQLLLVAIKLVKLLMMDVYFLAVASPCLIPLQCCLPDENVERW